MHELSRTLLHGVVCVLSNLDVDMFICCSYILFIAVNISHLVVLADLYKAVNYILLIDNAVVLCFWE